MLCKIDLENPPRSTGLSLCCSRLLAEVLWKEVLLPETWHRHLGLEFESSLWLEAWMLYDSVRVLSSGRQRTGTLELKLGFRTLQFSSMFYRWRNQALGQQSGPLSQLANPRDSADRRGGDSELSTLVMFSLMCSFRRITTICHSANTNLINSKSNDWCLVWHALCTTFLLFGKTAVRSRHY
jgi:hypothetical protein